MYNFKLKIMRKKIVFLLFVLCVFTIKAQDKKSKAIDYITKYYSDYSTNYDSERQNNVISGNYKASFSGSLFTLSFDYYGFPPYNTNKVAQKEKISIDLKDVIRFYLDSEVIIKGDDVEEPYGIPICRILAFKTKNEIHKINIHCQFYIEERTIEQTEIYNAFQELINSFKKT